MPNRSKCRQNVHDSWNYLKDVLKNHGICSFWSRIISQATLCAERTHWQLRYAVSHIVKGVCRRLPFVLNTTINRLPIREFLTTSLKACTRILPPKMTVHTEFLSKIRNGFQSFSCYLGSASPDVTRLVTVQAMACQSADDRICSVLNLEPFLGYFWEYCKSLPLPRDTAQQVWSWRLRPAVSPEG